MNILTKLIVIFALTFGPSILIAVAQEEDIPTVKIEKQEAVQKAVEEKAVEKPKEEPKGGPKAEAAPEKSAEGAKKGPGNEFVRTVRRTITGQVSGVSKDYIGVIYQATKDTEQEIGLLIEGTPALERVTDLSQIQMGDTVSVDYDELAEKDDNAQEVARHVVKKITFVKKASPPPPETSVLTSEEAGQ